MKKCSFFVFCCVVSAFLSAVAGELSDAHPLSDRSPLALEMRSLSRKVKAVDDGIRVDLPVKSDGTAVQASFAPPKRTVWDCSSKLWLLMDVTNEGSAPLLVRGVVKEEARPWWVANKGGVVVPANETRTLAILIYRKIAEEDEARLVSAVGEVKGYPGGHQNTTWRQLDAENLDWLTLDFYTENPRVTAVISGLRAAVDFAVPSEEELAKTYSPCMDRFGQARAEEWPLKIKRESDLKRRQKEELAWMDDQSLPAGWNKYGGWSEGPSEEATGHFRTLEKDGKWWLVDPNGKLFWSMGITGLNYELGLTTTQGIWKEFEKASSREVKPRDFPRLSDQTWNPYLANLLRKYGKNWAALNAEFTHKRLRAWGFNTLGNWTSREFFELQETPYVVAIHYPRMLMAGHEATYGFDLPDVFHPEFKARTFARMKTEEKSAADTWCIGYFVDNELAFSDPYTPGLKALESPEGCYTRAAMIENLQKKYKTIKSLNKAWKTKFETWTALTSRGDKKRGKYMDDLIEFSDAYLRLYFETCRDAVKSVAPNKLYLGSRINHPKNQNALRICSQFADVVSINLYDYTPAVIQVPEGMEAPIVIGEYHFATITEKGVWGGGLAAATDMDQAVELFRYYTEEAMKHPMIVGAHWFKIADQPLSGRGDGENHRVGFVDVTDTPYEKMVDVAREVSDEMYELRSNLK